MRHRIGKYFVCRRVRASFSPVILLAGAVKGLIFWGPLKVRILHRKPRSFHWHAVCWFVQYSSSEVRQFCWYNILYSSSEVRQLCWYVLYSNSEVRQFCWYILYSSSEIRQFCWYVLYSSSEVRQPFCSNTFSSMFKLQQTTSTTSTKLVQLEGSSTGLPPFINRSVSHVFCIAWKAREKRARYV